MDLKLTIYTNDELNEVKRVAEAERLKIPYRVSIYIISSLENISINDENDLIKFVAGSMDKLDKIIKATFGVSEAELECVDSAELISVGTELYKWAMDKLQNIKRGNNSKNSVEAV